MRSSSFDPSTGKRFMKHLRLATLALSALMLLPACASYAPAPDAFHQSIEQPYRLDSGDRLRITVFEQAGLSNTYSIDQAGYVAFPLIGAVAARGYTLQQIEGQIATMITLDHGQGEVDPGGHAG